MTYKSLPSSGLLFAAVIAAGGCAANERVDTGEAAARLPWSGLVDCDPQRSRLGPGTRPRKVYNTPVVIPNRNDPDGTDRILPYLDRQPGFSGARQAGYYFARFYTDGSTRTCEVRTEDDLALTSLETSGSATYNTDNDCELISALYDPDSRRLVAIADRLDNGAADSTSASFRHKPEHAAVIGTFPAPPSRSRCGGFKPRALRCTTAPPSDRRRTWWPPIRDGCARPGATRARSTRRTTPSTSSRAPVCGGRAQRLCTPTAPSIASLSWS